MAGCKHCGKPAGFMRHAHKQCRELNSAGRAQLLNTALTAFTAPDDPDLPALRDNITRIAQSSLIPANDVENLLVAAWERAVDRFLDDDVLAEHEEARLAKCKTFFLLNDTSLNRRGALTKTVKAGTIRDLLAGNIPTRVNVDSAVALNLQKNESIIWAFPNTEYLEDKKRTRYTGRSEGVSVRLMKGVYYRTGTFKGHPIEYTERKSYGKGLLVLTTKNIYFHGEGKSFRIPYSKIVSFEPFSDGIGVMRDAATAKPQVFVTGDGWFAYNIVSNVNNIE